MSSPDTRPKRYISRNGLDIAAKPSQYFTSYSLMTGSVNYQGATYNLKKIDLREGINLTELPEIQFINRNYSNPYLIRYSDYILEQVEANGVWQNVAVYILMENSDFDLRTYTIKYGPLNLNNMLKLCECLVGANYYLQKEINMAHGDIRPQNIRITLNQGQNQNNEELTFKLSYFDDILRVNGSHNQNKRDTLAYMAPELLCSSVISSTYFNQNTVYCPSDELKGLIAECPDEIRYDPFRADVFSAGLTAFSAATGIIFILNNPSQPFEAFRDGRKETMIISKNLAMVKSKYQCQGLTELLRMMVTHNPLLRCDFEEIAIRMNKLKATNDQIPHVDLVREESNAKHEYELLKENYWELQEMVSEMKDKESEQNLTIENLKRQVLRFENSSQYSMPSTNYGSNLLNDLSAIIPDGDENNSFLSSASTSPRKTLGSLLLNEKEIQGLGGGLLEQAEKMLSSARDMNCPSQNPHNMHNFNRKDWEDNKHYMNMRKNSYNRQYV